MGYAPTFERRFTFDGIDGKTVANTLVFTNPSAADLVLTGGVIRCTSASAITVGPTLGVGSAAGTNDIFLPAAILALTSQGKTFGFSLFGMSVTVPSGGTVSTSTTSTIGGPSTSVVILKICATNNVTEGSWTSVGTFESDQTITLAIALQSIQIVKGQLCADVPAGWYCKLVNSGTGTHSEAFISGQQTIYG